MRKSRIILNSLGMVGVFVIALLGCISCSELPLQASPLAETKKTTETSLIETVASQTLKETIIPGATKTPIQQGSRKIYVGEAPYQTGIEWSDTSRFLYIATKDGKQKFDLANEHFIAQENSSTPTSAIEFLFPENKTWVFYSPDVQYAISFVRKAREETITSSSAQTEIYATPTRQTGDVLGEGSWATGDFEVWMSHRGDQPVSLGKITFPGAEMIVWCNRNDQKLFIQSMAAPAPKMDYQYWFVNLENKEPLPLFSWEEYPNRIVVGKCSANSSRVLFYEYLSGSAHRTGILDLSTQSSLILPLPEDARVNWVDDLTLVYSTFQDTQWQVWQYSISTQEKKLLLAQSELTEAIKQPLGYFEISPDGKWLALLLKGVGMGAMMEVWLVPFPEVSE